MRKRTSQKASPGKTILLLFLIVIIFFSTSTILTAFPQRLFVDNNTKIGSAQFLNGNKLLLNGNMVQYNTGDVIPLDKTRGYIKLTGNQAQVGGTTYKEGIRTIVADLYQNILFSQDLGSFNSSSVAQIVVENTVINLIPISSAGDTFNINVQDLSGGQPKLINNYNVQFTQSTTYTNDNGIMLRLTKNHQKIYVSLVSIKSYSNIIFRAG